jgi:vitamin B12 transporter
MKPSKTRKLFCGGFLLSVLSITHFAAIASDSKHSTDEEDTLERISVVSSRIKTPRDKLTTSVTVVDKADIAARGSLALADVLAFTAGVDTSNAGGLGKNTTLRIRGEDGFRSKVYLDGVELSDPTAPQVSPIFDDITTAFIETVEILKGPQGLIYGADAGGIISITTSSAEQGLHGSLQVQTGRYATHKLNTELGAANQHGHMYLAASRLKTDGFNAQSSDDSNEKDGYDNRTLHFNSAYHIDDQIQLNFVLRQVDSDNAYDGCYDNLTFALINLCRTKGSNQTGRLTIDYQQGSYSHTFGVAQTEVERRFFSDEQFSFGSQGQINKFDYLGTFKGETQRFIWGLDNESQKIISSDLQRKQQGLFAEYQRDLDNLVFITAGLRYDDNDTFGQHISYRFSAAKLLQLGNGRMLKLRSAVGNGFRAPSLYEQDYNDGNFAYGEAAGLQLQEERSEGFDVGIEYFNATQQLVLELFKQRIHDEIYFDSLAYQGYLQNSLSSTSQGMELSIQQSVQDNWQFWGNYTYNHTVTSEGEVRLRRPKHQANMGIQSQWLNDILLLDFSVKWVKDAIDLGGVALDDYALFNVSGRYTLNPIVTIDARIDNLFDRQYQTVSGFNNARQGVYLGLSILF